MEYIFTSFFQKSSELICNNHYLIQICCFYYLWNINIALFYKSLIGKIGYMSKYSDKVQVCTWDLGSMCLKWQIKVRKFEVYNSKHDKLCKEFDGRWVLVFQLWLIELTLSWRRPLSCRNKSIYLLCKSMDWFLYDNGLRHERVKQDLRNLEKL